MLNNATIAQLRALKLVGFADALQQQHGMRVVKPS